MAGLCPGSAATDYTAMRIVGAVMIAVGALIVWRGAALSPSRRPQWIIAPIAVAVISLLVYFQHDPATNVQAFYALPVLGAFYFHGRRHGFAIVALVVGCYLAVVGIDPRQQHAVAARVLNMTALLVFVGVLVATLRERIDEAMADLERVAVTDALTGLANRRGFNEVAEREIERARRTGAPLAVLMSDIDRFKRINDEFGHATGDSALEHVARLIAGEVRAADFAGRIGGEEFAVLLPDQRSEDATGIAERLRAVVAASPHPEVGQITLSVGVAELDARTPQLSTLLSHADVALYEAKAAGRNCVRAAAPSARSTNPVTRSAEVGRAG